MIRYILPSLAALSVCAFGLISLAARAESPEPAGMERMQHWAADHEAMLDARLAGLKAGLKLTPDQEKLWPPFEAAIRDDAKMRMEHMKAMFERMHENRAEQMTTSPVDRLEDLAQHLSERGAAMKTVADAAKPLYGSFDDSQKRLFGSLSRELLMMGHGPNGMGMMGGMGMGMMGRGHGMMGGGGMGMMGGGPGMTGHDGRGPGRNGNDGRSVERRRGDLRRRIIVRFG